METETKTEVKTNEEVQQEWIKKELEELKKNIFDGERLPALELQENKNTKFTVDSSKPFQKWIDPNDQTVKKILPVSQGENKFVLWVNCKNPLYLQIMEGLAKGVKEFTVFRTGQKQNTRYTLVEE